MLDACGRKIDYLRISIGTDEEMDTLCQILKGLLA